MRAVLHCHVFHRLEKSIQEAFSSHIAARYGVNLSVTIEQPRQPDFGEIAIPVAFQLAKQLKQAPKKIAAELIDDLGPIPGVAAFEIAGNGYINVRFDRGAYAAALLRDPSDSGDPVPAGEKIIVEHTNINPNKAAHIGHLRNAVLGDTFVRMMRSRGRRVEVQNYIDNTGVQVADVVVGFHYLEKTTPAQVARSSSPIPRSGSTTCCWDLYAPHLAELQRQPRYHGLARGDVALDRGRRRRTLRTWTSGRRRYRPGTHQDDAAARH